MLFVAGRRRCTRRGGGGSTSSVAGTAALHVAHPFVTRSILMILRSSSSSSTAAALALPSLTYSKAASFAELIPRYDAFILDQFGVLHNGVEGLPGAADCIAALRRHGKRLIVLSNTSAPSDVALQRLTKFGLNPSDFVGGAVTSGEEACRYVQSTYGTGRSDGSPSKALLLTWDARDPNNPRLTSRPDQFLQRCGRVVVATTVEEADFVLLHGSEVWYRGPEPHQQHPLHFIDSGNLDLEVDALLHACVDRRLPMVCANADWTVRTPSGGTAHMPGKIAQRYLELGGTGPVFGKPHVDHFLACLDRLCVTDPSRVAHVGDSLHHDVAGANAAAIPSIFVTSGIHASEFDWTFGQLPPDLELEHLFAREGLRPTHVVASFQL